MEIVQDAFGQQLLAQFKGQTATAEFLEREDGYLDTGSQPGLYFLEYEQWSTSEQQLVDRAKGRVLDVGCGAGRHSLYLQRKGIAVTGIDNSAGAIEVCKLRGLKNALVRPLADVDQFTADSFDTVLMLGNNFGLFGNPENAKPILKKLSRITAPEACIIAGSRNPYRTDIPEHLEYHESNRQQGKMPGQIKMRVRYRKAVGEWFNYLLVSPEEMREILAGTEWRIDEFIDSEEANYFALISKTER
jgi:SAM-dependent methyltransferase